MTEEQLRKKYYESQYIDNYKLTIFVEHISPIILYFNKKYLDLNIEQLLDSEKNYIQLYTKKSSYFIYKKNIVGFSEKKYSKKLKFPDVFKENIHGILSPTGTIKLFDMFKFDENYKVILRSIEEYMELSNNTKEKE